VNHACRHMSDACSIHRPASLINPRYAAATFDVPRIFVHTMIMRVSNTAIAEYVFFHTYVTPDNATSR